MSPINGLLLLLKQLSIELIHELVDCNVEILFLSVGEEFGAPKVHLRFGLLSMFRLKDDVDVDDLIGSAAEAGEFFVDVIANSVRDVEVVTA